MASLPAVPAGAVVSTDDIAASIPNNTILGSRPQLPGEEAAGDIDDAGLPAQSGSAVARERQSCCRPSSMRGCLIWLAVVLAIIALLLGAAVYVAINLGTKMAVEEFIDIKPGLRDYCAPDVNRGELANSIWWPGCGLITSWSDFDAGCGGDCFSAEFMRNMSDFMKKYPGRLVEYPSKSHNGFETVTLRGWWLPPIAEDIDGNSSAPRVIVQHGFKSNSNNFRPVAAAYILRSLGFGVLVNNLRDHGYSDASEAHTVEWGGAYVFDLMGAWDYAVNDSDGLLGGSRSPDQVGAFGISMGGFITAATLGLEGNMPGAWMDSPPNEPSAMFYHGLQKKLDDMGMGWLFSILKGPIWANVVKEADERGVKLEQHMPETTLPLGPNTHRPVYVVTNTNDDTVPMTDPERLVAILRTMPEKYDVEDFWINDDLCEDRNHAADSLKEFKDYKFRVCNFFRLVFDLPSEPCDEFNPSA